jgi:hypothetical protein
MRVYGILYAEAVKRKHKGEMAIGCGSAMLKSRRSRDHTLTRFQKNKTPWEIQGVLY